MELWDIYDINKKKTGRVIDRCSNEKLRKGEYHLVVEAIIINSKGEILLSQRAETKKEYLLKWECIEGSCIKGETSLEAILREIKEEIGISLKKTEAIFYKTIKDDKAKDFKDIWLFRKDIQIKDLKFTDREVIDSKWSTIEEFQEMTKQKQIAQVVDFTREDYEKCLKLRKPESYNYIGKMVNIKIERPMGTKHPNFNMIYPVNYGYMPNTISGDGEELDAYLIGVFKPVKEYTGKCIAVIHRLKEDDDKLIIIPKEKSYTKEQIEALTEFQEKYFESEIIM